MRASANRALLSPPFVTSSRPAWAQNNDDEWPAPLCTLAGLPSGECARSLVSIANKQTKVACERASEPPKSSGQSSSRSEGKKLQRLQVWPRLSPIRGAPLTHKQDSIAASCAGARNCSPSRGRGEQTTRNSHATAPRLHVQLTAGVHCGGARPAWRRGQFAWLTPSGRRRVRRCVPFARLTCAATTTAGPVIERRRRRWRWQRRRRVPSNDQDEGVGGGGGGGRRLLLLLL